MRQSILALLLCLLAMPLMADSTAAGVQPATVLQVFVRDGCPHCDRAKAYLPALAGRYPQLEIVLRPVDGDPKNHRDWLQYSFRAGIWPAGVPAFVVADNMLLGFASAAETGPQLAALIEGRAVQQERLHNRWLGELSVSRLGLPLFTLAIGLLDGFNPCAMWVLLFLLSMLVHLQDRLRMALIAGCFVLVSALVYYAFMAAWLQLFLAVGISNTVRYLLVLLALLIGLANVRDYVAPGRRFTLSIPASAKPGMYARMRAIVRADKLALSLAGAALLAVLVNMIELLCTAGFPAMYTAILTAQQLDAASHYAYLALYIVAYMTDDALMVTLAVLALGSRKLDERSGRRLKLLSGLVLLALAAVMLLFPGLLL